MNWTFLVVDDNAQELAATASLLQRIYPPSQAWTATGGAEAIALLEERRTVPSLVFLDYAMPGMNGIEFLSEVRNLRWLERLPVVMLSEPIADRLVVNCYRLGASSFFAKPIHQFELRQAIRDFARPARQMASASVVSAPDPMRRSTAA